MGGSAFLTLALSVIFSEKQKYRNMPKRIQTIQKRKRKTLKSM